MIDVSDRNNPEFEDCFWDDGYTHDAQCVTYSGPDTRYTGREICIAFNEDTFTIVDITGPDYEQLSRTGYPYHAYTHQVSIRLFSQFKLIPIMVRIHKDLWNPLGKIFTACKGILVF